MSSLRWIESNRGVEVCGKSTQIGLMNWNDLHLRSPHDLESSSELCELNNLHRHCYVVLEDLKQGPDLPFVGMQDNNCLYICKCLCKIFCYLCLPSKGFRCCNIMWVRQFCNRLYMQLPNKNSVAELSMKHDIRSYDHVSMWDITVGHIWHE